MKLTFLLYLYLKVTKIERAFIDYSVLKTALNQHVYDMHPTSCPVPQHLCSANKAEQMQLLLTPPALQSMI